MMARTKTKHKYVNLEMLNTIHALCIKESKKKVNKFIPESINFITKNWFQFLVDKFIIPNVTSTCFNLKVVS